VVYSQSGKNQELLRIGWNRQDPRYLTTFAAKSSSVMVLDVRLPGTPYVTLQSHTEPVNAFSIAPHTSQYICTGGDDRRALIWDLQRATQAPASRNLEPVLRYVAAAEVVALEWATLSQDHIAICYTDEAQVLRV
jgi:WD40 repeat protein